MKKILAILLAGMMTATAFAGCGGGETSSQASGESSNTDSSAAEVTGSVVDESYFGDENNATLKVWAPDAAVELVKKQVEDFKKAYPNKTFNISVVAQGENDAATQILNDATVAADVFAFPSDQLNKLVDAGVMAPVAFVDQVTAMNDAETVKSATLKNAEGADTLYAYPETNDNGYYLVYDNTVVSDDQAKTLEGVLEACKAAGKKFIMDAGNGYFSCLYLFTGGLETQGLEEDGETQKFNDYDIDKVTATVKAFADLFKKYEKNFESNTTSAVVDGFKNGTTAAGIIGSWDVGSAKEALGDNAGFAILPTINVNGTDTQIINMFGYKFIGVNSQSKFPYTAQALAYYLTNEECQQERAELLEWGPSNVNVANSDFVKNSQSMSAILAQSEFSVPQTIIVGTFWDPCAALGTYMTEASNDFTTENVKAEVEKCINNILDL